MKYWNMRRTAPAMPAYLIEAIVVDFISKQGTVPTYPDLAFRVALGGVSQAVMTAVSDPKGIDGDINSLPHAERVAIAERARNDVDRAHQAARLEEARDHESSIRVWRQIFGDRFPEYG